METVLNKINCSWGGFAEYLLVEGIETNVLQFRNLIYLGIHGEMRIWKKYEPVIIVQYNIYLSHEYYPNRVTCDVSKMSNQVVQQNQNEQTKKASSKRNSW